VAGSSECDDEPSGSAATELVGCGWKESGRPLYRSRRSAV
jgi:hypothetical protein